MKPPSHRLQRTKRAERESSALGYTRNEVLRILHLKGRQLSAWESLGLIAIKSHYHFGDLSLLRGLREIQMPARRLRASVLAMEGRFGVRNPLLETSAVRRGSQVDFRHKGRLINPITSQLAFDFDVSASEVHGMVRQRTAADPMLQLAEAQEIFQLAVQLEEDSGKAEEAAELYRKILEIRPHHAPAAINLGTIHYNRREFDVAEQLYRQATVVDPEYALCLLRPGECAGRDAANSREQ